MSRSERRAFLYVLFLRHFFQEGHFSKVDMPALDEAIEGLWEIYSGLNTKTENEYRKMLKAADRVANVLRGTESKPKMMLIWAAEVAARFADVTTNGRRAAWQGLVEAITGNDYWESLMLRVPNEDDVAMADRGAELDELFNQVVKDELL